MPASNTTGVFTATDVYDRAINDMWTTSGFFGDTNFANTVLLLSGNGTNNANNSVFLDNSVYNSIVTRVGNSTQGSFTPYGVNWSNYFDGTTDYLSVPTDVALGFGTGDFTVEMWIYPTANPANGVGTIVDFRTAETASATVVRINSSFQMLVYNGPSNVETTFTSQVVTLNAWHHIAYVRIAGVAYGYINGKLAGSIAITSNLGSSQPAYIGTNLTAGYNFNGYISNFRVVKGTGLYTAPFTVQTSSLTTVTNTSLLTCQSNNFKDNSTNNFTVTKFGDITISRFNPFGLNPPYSTIRNGGSTYFDGTGDYITTPNTSAFDLSSSSTEFTIEAWVYNTAPGVYVGIFGARTNAVTEGWCLYIHTNNTLYTGSVIVGNAYADRQINTTVIPGHTWTHIALVKDATGYTAYVNGKAGTKLALTGGFDYRSAAPVAIGALGSQGEYPFYGYISDARIVKGTQVYTGNFTPPTAPLLQLGTSSIYPSAANVNTTFAAVNTSVLYNFTNIGIIDSTGINNFETVGDAKISTTQSKYGQSSIFLDGTGDYLLSRIPQLGTGDFTIEFWMYSPSAADCYLFVLGSDWSDGAGVQVIQYQGYFALTSGAFSYNPMALIPTVNQWHHVAVVRIGVNTKLYVDGVRANDGIGSSATNITATAFRIGNGTSGSWANFTGYINDFRITKGVGRYTANFTLPTTNPGNFPNFYAPN